jgi:hypothetical protein
MGAKGTGRQKIWFWGARWGMHGTAEDDEDDSGTPSSRGSAGSFEPDFTLSYADLRVLGRGGDQAPQQAEPIPEVPLTQNPRIPRPPLQRNLRRNSSKRLDSRDASRQSSISHSTAGAAHGTQGSEGAPLRSQSSAGLLRRLGTWAERVTLFVRSAPSEVTIGSTPQGSHSPFVLFFFLPILRPR